MIKANELRIGNLFYDDDNTPCYFAGAWPRPSGWIYRDSASNTYKDFQVYPIPLTPDILEKARFAQSAIGYYWKDENVCVYYSNSGLHEYQMHVGGLHLPATSRFKYLHQLQNLYFALTGEELDIKL